MNRNYSNDESTPLKGGIIDVEGNPTKGLFDTTTTAQKQRKKELLLIMLMGIAIGVLGELGVAGLSNTTTTISTSNKLKMEILDLGGESSPPITTDCAATCVEQYKKFAGLNHIMFELYLKEEVQIESSNRKLLDFGGESSPPITTDCAAICVKQYHKFAGLTNYMFERYLKEKIESSNLKPGLNPL